MIAKIPPGRVDGKSSIADLNGYIAEGKGQEKCEYAACRHCLSLETATLEMESLAHQNVRSKNPVFHVILSWREGETPTRAQVDEAVELALRELNLDECQAFYGLHRDTDNYHVHICVNRIHPETGKAIHPNGGWTKKGLERAARKIELAQGWAVERSGHLAEITENGEVRNREREPGRNALGGRARDHEDRTGEKSAERRAQEIAAPIITLAKSWQELHVKLQEQGFRFERKGSGAILWYGEVPVKASKAGRDCSLSKIEARLGVYEPSTLVVLEHPERDDGIPRDRENERTKAPDGHTPPQGPRAGGVFPSAAWERYDGERQRYEAERRHALEELRQEQDAVRKALLEQHREERKALLESRPTWKGRGSELNAHRSGMAARQAQERKQLQSDQARERRRTARAHPRFPAYKAWLKQRDEREAYEAWVSRWRETQHLEPGAGSRGETGEDARRDIRAFEWEARQVDKSTWLTEYRRKGEAQAAFVDSGRNIAMQKWREEDCVLAGLQLAASKWGSVAITGNEEFRHRAAVIATRHHIRVTDADLQATIRAEQERMLREREEWQERMAGRQSRQRDLFETYQGALSAERIRVTSIRLTPDDGKMTMVLDKDKGGASKGFSLDELEKRWPQLLRLGHQGENLYYTPLSSKYHYLIVDDLTKDTLDEMRRDGYAPAVVLQSSPGNYQAILKVAKTEDPRDREHANAVVSTLNKLYGDPHFSGAVHPHRAPGFENRKSKYQRADGTYPTVDLVEASGAVCEKAAEKMGEARRMYAELEAERAKQVAARERAVKVRGDATPAAAVSPEEAYRIHQRDIVARFGAEANLSWVDGMVAVRMRVTGHSREAVEKALESCAREVPGREAAHNWTDYAKRTAAFAFEGVKAEAQIAKNARYERIWRKLEGQDVSRLRDAYARSRGESRGR